MFRLHSIVKQVVAEMTAIGFGLPRNAFTSLMKLASASVTHGKAKYK